MKHSLPLLLFLLLCQISIAQPVNDDCAGLIDLGVAPICPTDIYTNVDATASDVGPGTIPDCFNGGNVDRDVWFAFTTDNMITDYTITANGITDGMGSTPITNPQIEIYRGDCGFGDLASLEVCASANDGDSFVTTNVFGLDFNTIYFIRINDYSSTATPNAGSFNFCITEYVPDINICDAPSSNSCTGTLYDCGGPDEDYNNSENHVFTICPNEFHECILIDLVDFNIDPFAFGFGDVLNFYAGDDNTAPLISTVTGTFNNNGFQVQTSSNCITIEFISDQFTTAPGFELTWQCVAFPCTATSPDNPTVIGTVPFNGTGLSTCDDASTVGDTPCPNDGFITGPEEVFTFDSPGDICVSIEVTGAEPGTGVLVLSAPPTDPTSICIAQSETGLIPAANLEDAGTYYIMVGNGSGCTDFNLIIEEAECALSPSLANALCNPINGCQEFDPDGNELPSVFVLEPGFQDIPNTVGTNNGCWFGVGAGAYYWFTIQSQMDGPFGFIFQGVNFQSDIDFNVWGPFTQDEVCEMPASVIDFITNNQPIRSSYAGGPEPTGLADINPVNGTVVMDEYDCDGNNDDYVTTIPTLEDEVYVVLINDWGGNITDGIVQLDWSPSGPGVLDPVSVDIIAGDTTICAGDNAQLELASGVGSYDWLNNSSSLSCTDCPNPIADPLVTTTYDVAIEGICIIDTISITVSVFDVDAGPDFTVCIGEDFQIVAGEEFTTATYTWTGTDLTNFSCTDCPDPIITATTPGVFTYTVTLNGPTCTISDNVTITVANNPAAMFGVVADTVNLCLGESTELGLPSNSGVNSYIWSSQPPGFSSVQPNPSTTPAASTTYYVQVTSPSCPVTSFDSVYVNVSTLPVVDLIDDIIICSGDSIVLANTVVENDVVYSWSPDTGLNDNTIANPIAGVVSTQTYVLTATRGACTIMDSVTITASPLAVEIQNTEPITICRGEEVNLLANVLPSNTVVTWTPMNGSVNPPTGTDVIVTPQIATTYYATVTEDGCTRTDSIYIDVDSIPLNMMIMPSDTMVCAGSLVILQSPTYEQSDFPEIDFLWDPSFGSQTSDTLYNMVIEAQLDTNYYIRTTDNGICTQMDTARIISFVPPEINITPGDTLICSGETVVLTASSPDVNEFTWTPGDIEESSITVNPTASTTYTVSAEFMGCPAEESIVVTVSPDVASGLAPNTSLCAGESLLLNTTPDPNPNTTYTWTANPPDATLVADAAQPTVTPSQTTTYTVVIDNGVCDPIEGEIVVTITNPSTLTLTGDDDICDGEDVTLTAEASEPGGTFTWTPGGFTTPSITVFPGPPTSTYSVSYDNGCGVVTQSLTITVNPANVVALPDEPSICIGENITLNSLPNPGISTYAWSADPADPTLDPDAVLPNVSPLVTTTYTVTVTNGVCPSIVEEVTVFVFDNPSLTVDESVTICEDDEITLDAVVDQEGGTFSWQPNGLEGPSIVASPAATTTYFVTYSYNCSMDTTYEITDSVLVNVINTVDIEILATPDSLQDGNTITAAEGEVLELFANPEFPLAGATFNWNTGQTGQRITYVATDGEVVMVSVTTIDGCIYEASVTVEVIPAEVEFPTAFTPNNDGVNDFFRPIISGAITVSSFKVFNRWGDMVYDGAGSTTGWDGNKKDKAQPSDVYVYFFTGVSPSGREFELNGDLTLIR